MPSRRFHPRAFRDQTPNDGNRSSRQYEERTTTTPPHGALTQLLSDWRAPAIEPRDVEGHHTEMYHHEFATVGCLRANQEHDDEIVEDDDDSDEAMAGSASPLSDRELTPPLPPLTPNGTKRSRYLREADHHAILERIDNGEKQAELAREFGVTRAAICHIKKNRVEILARATRPDVHAAARHPKRRMTSVAVQQRQHQEAQQRHDQQQQEQEQQQQHHHQRFPTVYEVPSPALANHLATLQSRATDRRTFRAIADRAFWLLVEEALALAHAWQMDTSASSTTSTHRAVVDESEQRPVCAMVMGEGGFPLLEAFRAIQPDSPTGFMTLARDDRDNVMLRKMSAPLALRDHSVFLLDATCGTGRRACVAIQSLLDFGAHESHICFVTLAIRAVAVDEIRDRFPHVRVVTAAVELDGTSTSAGEDAVPWPGMGNFLERYFNTTTIIHRHGVGSSVDL